MPTGYIPASLQGGGVGGVQLALAAAYESRVHTISKMTVARAQFAGDTNVTLTDGSYNVRDAATPSVVPKSATAVLANSTNTYNPALLPVSIKNSWGKPLVIKIKRDEFTSEITAYAVFNADGTIPGSNGTTAQDTTFDPWGANARYKVNPATGEIYVNKAGQIVELKNPDGLINFSSGASNASNNTQDMVAVGGDANMEGGNMVVGMVEFETLQGGALSAAQQQAAELSTIIQSLTSVLRSISDGKKEILSLIK